MEDLVGKTFRDVWDVLGLRKLYIKQLAAYMKAKGEGIGEMKKSGKANGVKKSSRGSYRERRQDRKLDRLLTREKSLWGFVSW